MGNTPKNMQPNSNADEISPDEISPSCEVVKVILTWIPTANNLIDNKVTINCNVSTSIINKGFWEHLKTVLKEHGKSIKVNFMIQNVHASYNEGKPVYKTVWIGAGNDEISSRYFTSKTLVFSEKPEAISAACSPGVCDRKNLIEIMACEYDE